MENSSFRKLEFDKIIAMLADRASSPAGRSLCLKLRPSSELRQIRIWQQNTTDACARMSLKGSALSLRGLRDITPAIRRLEKSASLSAAELLSVSAVLTAAERAVHYDSESREDSLSETFGMIEPLVRVNRELRRCILSEDEFADDASPELLSVRTSMKRIDGKIHESIGVLLNTYREYLSDAVVTQRDGRYCLPVRAEFKSRVSGMVHDASSTGQTLFIEPMTIVKLNNDLRELEAAEKKAIEEILRELSGSLSPYTFELSENVRLLARLDMIFAKALLSGDMMGEEPVFSDSRQIELMSARHPLIPAKSVVPISLTLGRDFDLLVITGPNTGGKTVSLKTVGLLQLMGQTGLHIPANKGSVLGVFEEIYADIGDEQSIEQSLSTFSSHMTNIVRILDRADSHSLCLFDELGSGTDPTEGAALAMAILSFLHNMKTRTVATTHYSEIKIWALRTPGVENAGCEFDVASLRPTYRLRLGIPGRSNAFAIAERLGLSGHLIDDARKFIESEDERFEDVITGLNEQRSELEKNRAAAESFRLEAEQLKKRLTKKEERLDESREKLLADAKKEAERILREARETADDAVRTIREIAARQGEEMDPEADVQRERIRSSLKKAQSGQQQRIKGPSKPVSPRKIKPGDEVRVSAMGGITGNVLTVPDKDGNVFVQLGMMKSKLNVRQLEFTEGGQQPKKRPEAVVTSGGFTPKALDVRPELNLIGMTTDEALPLLEKYLDDAYLAHLETVRIVHGRGTGALRTMVQNRLRKLKYVKEFRLGSYGEGDSGVTVVTFR